MKRSILWLALLAAIGCKSEATAQAVEPKTEDQKTLYALGTAVGRNLTQFHLTPEELAHVVRGMSDAAASRPPLVDSQTYGPKIEALVKSRRSVGAADEKKKGAAFAEAAAKEPGAVADPSGLVFRTLQPGTGPSPKATDTVKVHYEGKLVDGTVFDSSIKRGPPIEFQLTGVIKCWTDGVQRMKVGEKAKLVCPSAIAYGDDGRPPVIPGGATLVFEVELIDIRH